MPTPFMHLQFAEQIRHNYSLPTSVTKLLDQEWAAFCLGNIAPDVQTICGLSRRATHFYAMPPMYDAEGYEVMFVEYPGLRWSPQMPAHQASFLAGYCTHLLFDVCWFRYILLPTFIEPAHWGDHENRFFAHNILLIYLDRIALNSLTTHAGTTLAQAQPQNWLPFVTDESLAQWRDVVAGQLHPGADIATISVYADRMRLSSKELQAIVSNPEWVNERVFRHVPLVQIQTVLEQTMERSAEMITHFLST